MTFPVLTGTTTYSATGLTTSWTPFSSETVAVGELLVVFINFGQAGGVSTSSPGWSVIAEATVNGGRLAILTKTATATTESLTVTPTSGNFGAVAAVLDRYTGADKVEGTLADAGASSTTPDPPSASIGVTRDVTWAALVLTNSQGILATSGPTGYGALTTVQSGSGGANVGLSLARKNVSASSEDPGSFTLSSSFGHALVATIAIYKYRRGVRSSWAF